MYMSKRMLMAVVARKLKKLRIKPKYRMMPYLGIPSHISKYVRVPLGNEWKKPSCGIAPKQPNSAISKCVRVQQETESKKPETGIPSNQPKCTIFKCGRKQGYSWKKFKIGIACDQPHCVFYKPRVQQMWKDKQYKMNKIIGILPNRPTSAIALREIEQLRREMYFKNGKN